MPFPFVSILRNVKLSAEVYERYFGGGKPGEVAGIVEDALAAWFGKGGVADVPGGSVRNIWFEGKIGKILAY